MNGGTCLLLCIHPLLTVDGTPEIEPKVAVIHLDITRRLHTSTSLGLNWIDYYVDPAYVAMCFGTKLQDFISLLRLAVPEFRSFVLGQVSE